MKPKYRNLIAVVCAMFLTAGFGLSSAGAQQQGQKGNAQADQQAREGNAQADQSMAQNSQVTEGARLYISPATVLEIQKQLRIKGFRVDNMDGRWGNNTAEAVKKFQRVQGLEPTGNLNIETLDFLGVLQSLQKNPQPGKWEIAGKQTGEGAPLFVSPSAVRQVQQQLSQNGFDPGPIDGLWGPNTQAAVRKYEKSKGIEPTGNLNVRVLSSIGGELGQLVASLTTTGQQQQQGQQQMAQARQGQQQQQVRGYYGPQGQTGQQQASRQKSGREGFIPLFGPEKQEYAGEGAPLFVSADVVKQIQEKLNQAGYKAGNTKGDWDNQTSQALRNFQQSKDLEPTGNLNIRTMEIMLGGLSADMFRTGGGQGQQQSR